MDDIVMFGYCCCDSRKILYRMKADTLYNFLKLLYDLWIFIFFTAGVILLQGEDLHGAAASHLLGIAATAGLLTILVLDGIHLMAMGMYMHDKWSTIKHFLDWYFHFGHAAFKYFVDIWKCSRSPATRRAHHDSPYTNGYVPVLFRSVVTTDAICLYWCFYCNICCLFSTICNWKLCS